MSRGTLPSMPVPFNKEEASALKRKTFDRARCPNPRMLVKKIPKASSLIPNEPMVRPPPSHVIQKLGHASVAIGFDIETHDLAESGGAGIGRFGHPWRSNASIFRLRIVQIGWAIGDCTLGGTIRERVERLVIPDGFAVSERATKKHGITNERANGDGVQIAQALEEFMRAAWSIHELQGVVVAHHIEFDAGVLDEELHRCGLDSWRPYWHIIATGGVCTMDPDIQAWIQHTFGNDRGAGEKALVMNLRQSIMLFYNTAGSIRDLMKKAHTAGADAEMHLLLYQALRDLAAKGSEQEVVGTKLLGNFAE